MKKNWNKFVKNFKTSDENNSKDSIDKSVTKEELEENLFLKQIQKIMENDFSRNSFLNFCDDNSVLSFDIFLNNFRDLVRFDYGSYAELFSGYHKHIKQMIVLKVIRAISFDLKNRIRGPEFRSRDGLFDEIHNEFQISEELSKLSHSLERYETHCFPKVFGKYLVSGNIPPFLLKNKISDELPPIKEEIFEDFISIPREYAILIMSFGGQPLWKAIKNRSITSSQLLSVVLQLTIGLAVAEAAVEFEHRDLHISNILIKETTKQKIHFIYNFNRFSVNSEGFEAVIIDTTFSRIRIGNRIHCKNLTNIMKFNEDSELSSQDKCYQSMVKLTNNDWNKFTPKTNINWLLYICKLLLKSKIMRESDDNFTKERLKHLIDLFRQKQSLQELDLNIFCK